MSERQKLTKVKIKKSQEKHLNFENLAIQEFCDDIELDMNYVNRMLYDCVKIIQSKLGVKPTKKKNLAKIKHQSGKLIFKRESKQ